MSVAVHLPTIQQILDMGRVCTDPMYMGAQTILWIMDMLLPCGMMKSLGMTTVPIDAMHLLISPVDTTLRLASEEVACKLCITKPRFYCEIPEFHKMIIA